MKSRAKHHHHQISVAPPPVTASTVTPAVTTEPPQQNDAVSTPRGSTLAEESAKVIAAVRSRWREVVAIAMIATGLAWLLAASRPPHYRAEVLVAVVPAPGIDADQVFRGVEVLQYRTVVATLAALASTGSVATDAAANAAGHYDISAFVLPHADLLRIEVNGPDAASTAAIANRLPPLLSAQAQSLYRFYAVTAVEPAKIPTAPASPPTSRAIATGIVAGLLAGVAFVAITSRLKFPRVRVTRTARTAVPAVSKTLAT